MVNNYAFVDAQNVNLSVQNQGRKLDWNKFRVYLSEQYHVTQAYLFIGFMEEQKELYEFLQQAGFTLIYKAVHTTKEGMTKGNVDAELVLQAMIDLPNYDQAIIVTGDGDFACLVKYLLEQKKLLKLIVPNIRQHSGLLRDVAADYITSLSALKMKLKFRGKKIDKREKIKEQMGKNIVPKIEENSTKLSKVVKNSATLSKVVENSQTSGKIVQNRPTLRKIEEGRKVEERRSPLERQKQPPQSKIHLSSKEGNLKSKIPFKKPDLLAVAQKAKQLLIQHEHDVPKASKPQIIPRNPSMPMTTIGQNRPNSSKIEEHRPILERPKQIPQPTTQHLPTGQAGLTLKTSSKKPYRPRFTKKGNQERERPSFLE